MPQASVRLNESGTSVPIPIDLRRFSSGVGLILTIIGQNVGVAVQVTGDDIFREGYRPILGMWNYHDTLFNITVEGGYNGNLEYPVTAVRLVVFSIEPPPGGGLHFANLSVVQAEG